MHGNLSSCAESVFIAARRPRGVARERENGEERVASNPERQLNPCTRPRPFLHNTYVQPLTNVTNTGGKRCKTRLRNGGLRGRSIVFAAKNLFRTIDTIFSAVEKDGAVAQNRNEAWSEIDRRFSKQNLERFFFFFKEVSEPTCTRLGNYSHGSLVPRRLDDEVREGRPTAYLPHRHVLNVREHKTNLKRWNGETKKRRDSKREDFFFVA